MIFLLRSELYSQNPKTYNITVKGRGTLFKKMDNMNDRKRIICTVCKENGVSFSQYLNDGKRKLKIYCLKHKIVLTT